jgi:hypothetical protein
MNNNIPLPKCFKKLQNGIENTFFRQFNTNRCLGFRIFVVSSKWSYSYSFGYRVSWFSGKDIL